MPLVTTTEMFKKAYDGGYAIGAFNVNNMEIVQGITEAAKDLNAPLILQVSKGARNYANHTYLMKLVEAAVEETGLPIALHLDHGDSFELCKSCIDGGFTSVMIDASSKSFEDNIALTKQVVEYAHDHGVVVEAELGTLAGVEDEVKVKAANRAPNRSSVSTFLRMFPNVCRDSPLYFMVLLPFLRNLLRRSISSAEICLVQSVFLKISFVRPHRWLYARLTSIPIFVLP